MVKKFNKYLFTDESVKRQITDSISENLTDSDLESRSCKFFLGVSRQFY